MDTSIFIAKIFAIAYLAIGLGMFLSAGYYKKAFAEMMKSKTYIFGGGAFALVIGLLLVSYHNIWESSWVVIVTIIGWIALVKGVLLLLKIFTDLQNFSSS